VLGLAAAGFFEQYDTALLTLAATDIADGLGVGVATFGVGVAIIRLGALGGVPVLRLSDRLGRRGLLIVSLAAFTVLTGLTALAWSLAAFVVLQTLARVFLAAEHSLSSLVISEEVRADRRGAAISLLGFIATAGPGAVALLLLVVPLTPLDWRLFYVFALVPLAIVAILRRTLKETKAFEVAAAAERIQPSLVPHVAPEHRPRPAADHALRDGGRRPADAVLPLRRRPRPGRLRLGRPLHDHRDGVGPRHHRRLLRRRPRERRPRPPARAGHRPDPHHPRDAHRLHEVRALFPVGFFVTVAAYACLQACAYVYLAELFPTEVRAGLSSFAITAAVVAGSIGLGLVAAFEGLAGRSTVMVVLAIAMLPALLLLRSLPETAGRDVVGGTDRAVARRRFAHDGHR
jgi:MFS family permease